MQLREGPAGPPSPNREISRETLQYMIHIRSIPRITKTSASVEWEIIGLGAYDLRLTEG